MLVNGLCSVLVRVLIDCPPLGRNVPRRAFILLTRCFTVNGIRKGEGKGSSKQIAKEEAARQAYYSMGWT